MIALFFLDTPWRGDDPRQETTVYDLRWMKFWENGGQLLPLAMYIGVKPEPRTR